MRILWAPWRSKYVESVGKIKDCFLCDAAFQPKERWQEFLVLYKGDNSFIILNKYPYNTGHLMVVPFKHTGSYEDLDEETVLEMHHQIKLSLRILREAFSPHGFNIGCNLGRSAGAGLETHVHIHIVPRWNGDTNFLPVLANTKVISQDLSVTYTRLKSILDKL